MEQRQPQKGVRIGMGRGPKAFELEDEERCRAIPVGHWAGGTLFDRGYPGVVLRSPPDPVEMAGCIADQLGEEADVFQRLGCQEPRRFIPAKPTPAAPAT